MTGRADEGRLPVMVLAVDGPTGGRGLSAPALVFADDGDQVVADAQIGQTLRLDGTVQPADPGDDIAALVFAHGNAVMTSDAPPLLAASNGIREGFRALVAELPGDGADLLPGLAIGDTTAVTPELDTAMKQSSLSHLTAVSGSNCAVVVGLVFALAALLGARRALRVAVAGAALLGFVMLVTPQPSVVRAAVMAAVALVAVGIGRPARGVPLLCVAVIGLLIADPWMARSYGFALSVLATGGLLLLAAPLAARLSLVLPRALALVIAVPVAAQAACQPVLLLLDPAMPVYGVVANILAEPAAPIATVLGLIACLLAPVAPPLAAVIAALAWVPASWIAAVATVTAALPGARVPWPVGPVGVVLLMALTAAAIVAVLGLGPYRVRLAARAILVVAVVGYVATLAGTRIATEIGRPPDWQYALCDVGQGDATVIRSGGSVALVDTGPDPEPLAACLDTLGVDRIDLLVLTHYDLDHVGGVDAVVGRVDRALIGPPDGADDLAMASEVAAAGAQVDQVSTGERGSLGALDWRVVWPPARGVEPGNPASVVLAFDPGASCRPCLSGVLLGDLGNESQKRLAGAASLHPVDVVKVAHHGSADQAAELYEQLHATVGLIGVGADNDYGHPTAALLDILTATATTPYRSDQDGLVLVAPGSASGEVRVWTER